MPPFDRQFWRAAGHLEHYLKNRADDRLPEPPNSGCFRRLQALTDRLRVVEQRGLQAAAKSVAMALHVELWRCQSQVTTALEFVASRFAPQNIPTQAELYAEIVALTTEFEHCEIDLRKGTLSVVTESIVLDNVHLGPFQIFLHWKLGHISTSQSPYTVVALDPCCPEYRSHITHPHVMSDRLCEGEAMPTLRKALQTGRLTDFFQIINQVLHTYNSHSPYAPLSDWEGTDCQDCGTHISSDCSHCYVCSRAMCDDCSTCCMTCDASTCNSCARVCPRCDSEVCIECAKACQGCGSNVCPDCLNPTTNLCQECEDVPSPENCKPAEDPTTPEPKTDLTIQPTGLGQIAVPARSRAHRSRRFRRRQRRRSALCG